MEQMEIDFDPNNSIGEEEVIQQQNLPEIEIPSEENIPQEDVVDAPPRPNPVVVDPQESPEFEEVEEEEPKPTEEESLKEIFLQVLNKQKSITEKELKEIFNDYTTQTAVDLNDLKLKFKEMLKTQPILFDRMLNNMLDNISRQMVEKSKDLTAQFESKIQTSVPPKEPLPVPQSDEIKEQELESETRIVPPKSNKNKMYVILYLFIMITSLGITAYVVERGYSHKISLDLKIQERLKDAENIEAAIKALKERKKFLETILPNKLKE
jgi:hypothetical protein